MFFRNALVVGLWADASLVSGGRTPRHRRQADSNGGVDPWKNTTVAAPSTSSETIITTSPEDYDITSSDSGGDAAIPETSDSSSSDEQVATYSTTSSSIELTTSSVPDTDPASIPTSSQSQALPPSSAGAETYSSSDSPSVDFYSGSDSSSSTYPDESAPELTTTSEYIDTWTSSTETVQATVNQPTGDAVSTAYVQPTSPNAVDSSTSDVLLSSTSPPQDESARTSYGRQTGDGASTAYVPATSSSTKGTSTLTPQPPSSSTSTSEDEGAAKSYGKPTGEAVSPAYLPPTSSGTGDVLTTIVSSSSAANPQEEATAEYVDTRTPTAKASSVLPTGDGASPSAYVAPTSQGTGDAYVPNAQPSSSSNSDDDTMSPPASSPSSPSSVIMVGLTDSYVTYSKSASTGTVATDMKQAGTDSDSGNTYKETAFAYPAAASGSPTALPKYEETTYGNPTGVSGPDTGFSQGVEPLSSTGVSGPMTGPLAQHTDMPSGYSPGVSGSTGTSTSCTTTGSTEINTYQPTGGSAPSSYGPQPVGPATAPSSGQPSVIVQPTGPSSGTPTVVVTPTPPQPYNPTGHPRYPYGTGRHSRNTTNAICSGATLNVLQASLDWWYTATYTHVASTFSVLFDRNDTSTGWTLLPETTTFDVASALASPSCTSSLTSYSYYNYNGGWNATNGNWSTYSYYDQDCFSTPAPLAAATTVITQTAHTSLKPNVTSGSGKIPDVIITPTPATISVPGSTGAFSAGTPFVYFSQYEIMSKYNSTRNGSVRCAETTSRYNMTSPFGFAYTGGDVDGQKLVGEGVIGDVNPDFLKIVNVSNAVAGNWVAKPTVAVVQQRIFVAQAVLAAFTEAPLRTLATPEPTLPDYVPLVPSTTDGGSGGKPTGGGGGGGRIESSAESLAVPGSPATTKEATKTSAPGSKDDSDTGSGGGSNSGPNSNNGSGSGSNSGSNDNDSSGSGSGSNLGSNDNNGSGSSSSSNSGSSDNNGSGSSSGSNSGSNDNGGSGNGSGSNSGSGDSNGSASDSSSDSGSNGKDASGSGSGSNSNDGNGSGSDGNSGSNANGGAAVGGSSSSDDDGNTVLAPFVAQDESSQITLNIPVQPTQTVVTAEFQGQRVTATALSVAQDQGPPSPSPGPNVGNLVSAVESAAQPAKPTNALDVFNSAANQGDGKADDEAVASAIMAGIGGSSAGGAAQSGGQDGSGSGSSQDGENGGGNDGSSSSGSGSSGSGGSGGSGSSGDGASGSSQGSSGSGSSGSGSNSGSDSQGASGSSGGSSSPDGSAQGQSGSSGSQAGWGSGSSSESGSSSGSSNGQAPFAAPILSFGDSTITAGPTPAVVFGGQTAFPGGDAIVQDGHTISLVQRGNALVVDGSTVSVAAGSLASSTVLDVNGVSVTASPEQVFNVDGQRLAAGGSAITVDGTTVSVASDGSAAVINGQTRSLQMTTMGASGSNPGNQQAQGAAANIPLITVGSQTFTANAATQFSLASGATLTPGGVVTFDGTTVSLARDASQVVVNGQTTELNAPRLTPAPMVTLDGTVYKANPGSTFDINGSILTPGGVITSDGTRISLAPGASAIVVDGETTSLQSGGSQTTPASNEASITAAPVLPVDGHRVQPQGQGATYVISGQTLTPGGAITYTNDDGEVETLSLNSPANQLVSVIDGTTSSTNLPNPAAMSTITAPPVLNVNGKGYAANGGTSYVISGQTLTPGGAITITNSAGEAETLSLNSAANELYTGIEGTTATSMIAGLGAMSTGAPVLTIDGQTYTANSYDSGSGPTYVISGQTLTRGGEITLSGSNGEGMETVSLDSAGTAIEIISDGQTSTSTIPGAYEVMPTAAPILTINGETFTAMNNGATYIISGKTLTPNEAETVTISGRTFVVSLAPQASLLVISAENGNGQVTATSYETLFPVQMTGGVVTNTVDMNGGGNGGAVTRTSMSPGASATGSNTPEEYDPSLQNSGSSLAVQITGFAVAAGSLVLAVFL